MSNSYIKPRRKFLQSLTLGAAALGTTGLTISINASAGNTGGKHNTDPEAWMKKITGKHRIVYDVTEPHHQFPFAWPRVFLLTNEATGTPPNECSVVVILRHNAIPFAMDNRL